jgi:hypothetical protein
MANDNNQDVVEDFWKQFGNDTEYVEVECDSAYSNLAQGVLSYYNIPHVGSNVGGELKNIDIKHMDALSVIKMSLMEQTAIDGNLYEVMVNNEGEVIFKNIGGGGAYFDDIYHQMQTYQYVEKCSGVIVHGGTPLPVRKSVAWKPIWGSEENDKKIYDTDIMFNNCLKDSFSNYASIIFRDPHISTQGGSQYEDGIDNFYEISDDNPWDRILGYANFLNVPAELSTSETTVTLASTSSMPIRIAYTDESDIPPSLGNLQRHPVYTDIEGADPVDHPDCWAGLGSIARWQDGIEVPIPSTFRFEDIRQTKVDCYDGISDVYVIGIPIARGLGHPVSAADAIQTDSTLRNTSLVLTPASNSTSIFKLSEGEHYVVAYKEADEGGVSFKFPYIVFANNSRINDPARFGGNVSYKWDTSSEMYDIKPGEQKGSILPTSTDGKAILVKEVWVKVNLNTPSINIYDPSGMTDDGKSRAVSIAEELKFLVTPVVIVEEPAPMAFNGEIINQIDSIADHDPTTTDNFEDTAYELTLDKMDGGGGLTMTMSCLDADGCVTLSKALHDFMNSGDGVYTLYTCGPLTEANLGDFGPANGIINNITYNYTDSGSYTISIGEGPRIVGGLTEVTGIHSPKATEDISASGTIIQDMGNNIHFKVRIDGFGERVAFNTSGKILRVGDKVSCSVHNNPVES